MAGHAGDPGSKRSDPGLKAKKLKLKNKDPYKTEKHEKTKGFDYKGGRGEGKKFVAGANVIDEATGKVSKRKEFSEYLKDTGNRADDPRNWEFHYKKGGHVWGGKDMTASEKRSMGRSQRRSTAERKAKTEGAAVYDIQKMEYETQGIKQGTEESSAKRKAIRAGRAGTTRVGRGVAAQRQAASRRSGRASARSSSPFDAPSSKRRTSRIA